MGNDQGDRTEGEGGVAPPAPPGEPAQARGKGHVKRWFDRLIDLAHHRVVIGIGALLTVLLPLWGGITWFYDVATDREVLVQQAQATTTAAAERQMAAERQRHAEERERLQTIIEQQSAALATVGRADDAGIADITAARVDEALKLAKRGDREQASDILVEVAAQQKNIAAQAGNFATQAGNFATQKVDDAETARRAAAETYRQLGALASLDDTRRALAAYREAAELDPDDTWTWINIARLERQKGRVEAAAEAAAKARDAALASGNERDELAANIELGDIAVATGDLKDALAAFTAALSSAERLAAGDPGDAGWQYDLGISNERVGNVQMAQGNLSDALKSYQTRHDIISRLATGDSSNAGWQRDLSVSHDKIGDVLVAQGDLAAALASYEAGLSIRERLAAGDPGNAGWQRDLAVSHWKLAGYGTEPRVHWQAVVDILTELDNQGRLAPTDKKWLPIAKENLAAAER